MSISRVCLSESHEGPEWIDVEDDVAVQVRVEQVDVALSEQRQTQPYGDGVRHAGRDRWGHHLRQDSASLNSAALNSVEHGRMEVA